MVAPNLNISTSWRKYTIVQQHEVYRSGFKGVIDEITAWLFNKPRNRFVKDFTLTFYAKTNDLNISQIQVEEGVNYTERTTLNFNDKNDNDKYFSNN